MLWGLAFLVVAMIAVAAFILGRMSAQNSSSSVIGSRYNGEIDALEPLDVTPLALQRESSAGTTPSDGEFDRREQARRTFQQLKQLEELKTKGMITTAEYSAKRAQVLNEG